MARRLPTRHIDIEVADGRIRAADESRSIRPRRSRWTWPRPASAMPSKLASVVSGRSTVASSPHLSAPLPSRCSRTALDPDNVDRFVREQRAMGKLSGHPNIVSMFQSGTTKSGRPYIVMQYHPRDSLNALIETGPIGWQESLHIGVKIAGALETAHRRGTLHRDIKPANILLTEYGEPELTDFGIARISGGFETATGVLIASPAFTAPEVLGGQTPTAAADLYSLGATLLCALNGHAPLKPQRSPGAAQTTETNGPVPRRPTYPPTCAPPSTMRWRATPRIVPRPPPSSGRNCGGSNAATA